MYKPPAVTFFCYDVLCNVSKTIAGHYSVPKVWQEQQQQKKDMKVSPLEASTAENRRSDSIPELVSIVTTQLLRFYRNADDWWQWNESQF